MSIDLDEIRAALAEYHDPEADELYGLLYANAPTWLAALCDEIERLRADEGLEESAAEYERTIAYIEAERVAALAEVERLRGIDDTIDRLIAEGDAWRACADQLAADMRGIGDTMALAVYERLRGAKS